MPKLPNASLKSFRRASGWAIYNFGVSGYGPIRKFAAKEVLRPVPPLDWYSDHLRRHDNDDNAWNFRGGYYKPTLDWNKVTQVAGHAGAEIGKNFFTEHKTLSRSFIFVR